MKAIAMRMAIVANGDGASDRVTQNSRKGFFHEYSRRASSRISLPLVIAYSCRNRSDDCRNLAIILC